MAERQQKLRANRIAGRPELSEQATDDGKRTEAGSSLTERSSINSAGSSMCRTVGGRRRRRRSRERFATPLVASG
jgi:hypothetical protein